MFVLVIDDLRLFGEKFNDMVIQYAVNSREALKFLEANFGLVSEIWLDHDLGGDDTSIPVVDWLDEKARNGEANHITAIRILTDNPVGYQKIMLALSPRFYVGLKPRTHSVRETSR